MGAKRLPVAAADRRTRLRRSADADSLLRAFSEGSSEGIVIHDAAGALIAANHAAERMMARPRPRLGGSPALKLWDAVHEDGSPWPVEQQPHVVTMRTRKAINDVVMGINRQGLATTWIRLNTRPVFLSRLRHERAFITSFVDLTEERETRRALEWSEQRFRDLVNLSSDWYWEQDRDFRFVHVSAGVQPGIGLAPERFVGRTRWEGPWTNMAPPAWDAHRNLLARHAPFLGLELQRLGDDGCLQSVIVSGTPVFDRQGSFVGYRGIGRNITAEKQSEARLKELTHFDTVTGLPNRALLMDRMERALSRAKRSRTLLATMVVDLDEFKEINDALGHAAGDEVLREIGARLRLRLRDTDTVARYSGAQFTILLEGNQSVEQVAIVAQKVLDAVAPPLRAAGSEVFLTASIGISVYPNDGETAEGLLKNADVAMYHAMRNGRSTFQFFSADMGTRTSQRLDLQTRLRRALERDEFVLHYQPQLDISTGRIIGVEALVRWKNGDLGLIPPGQFIPLAEDNGLIVPIGEWVTRTACAQMRAWQKRGFGGMVMAVNLSPRQFRDKGLLRTVADALRDAGLEAPWLELEITEGTVMHGTQEAIVTLGHLHSLGVQLSVDDFGTGYSSLAYLKRFPVQKLKVDQSFVRDIRSDRDDAVIVNTVIALAKSLGLTAIAEGVETVEQLDHLRTNGCDEYQGYYFSKPLPVEGIDALLARQQPVDSPT